MMMRKRDVSRKRRWRWGRKNCEKRKRRSRRRKRRRRWRSMRRSRWMGRSRQKENFLAKYACTLQLSHDYSIIYVLHVLHVHLCSNPLFTPIPKFALPNHIFPVY